MQKTVAILTPKGGGGKTTLAVNLACELQRRGERVLIVDLDPQGTATDWRHRAGSEELPDVVHPGAQTEMEDTLRELNRALREWEGLTMIDGGAQISRATGAAVRAADVVLIPVRPSVADVWGVRDLVDVVKDTPKERRPYAAFVVCQADPRTNLSKQITGALNGYDLPTLNARTCQRIQYAKSLMNGSDVASDAPSSKAAQEINSLADELTEILTK